MKIFGMDDSQDSFPVGEFRFLNFTDEPVSVDFSGSLKKVDPGQFSTVPAHATNGDGAGTPGGAHSSPGDSDYTAVWSG